MENNKDKNNVTKEETKKFVVLNDRLKKNVLKNLSNVKRVNICKVNRKLINIVEFLNINNNNNN